LVSLVFGSFFFLGEEKMNLEDLTAIATSGAMAGFAKTFISHPLDTVKVSGGGVGRQLLARVLFFCCADTLHVSV